MELSLGLASDFIVLPRLDQILASVAGKMRKQVEDVKEEAVQKLVSLIQCHYVERSPPCDLPPMPSKQHPDSMKKKSAKGENIFQCFLGTNGLQALH